MSELKLYSPEPILDGYTFWTKYGVQYFYFFNAGPGNLLEIPEMRDRVFAFSFFVINAHEFDQLPADPRVGGLLTEVIAAKLAEDLSVVVYIVDDEDARHSARERHFHNWFRRHRIPDISEFTAHMTGRRGRVAAVLLFHTPHPYSKELQEAFKRVIEGFSKD